MDLCSDVPLCNLYDKNWPIRTFQEQVPPARVVRPHMSADHGPAAGELTDSILSGGCIISGGTVDRSVLSNDVEINEGASVSESVLLDGVTVGRNAKVRKAIVDEGVAIPEGCSVGYDPNEDGSRFTMSPGGIAIVPRGISLE